MPASSSSPRKALPIPWRSSRRVLDPRPQAINYWPTYRPWSTAIWPRRTAGDRVMIEERDLHERLAAVRLLAMDVDGVLTDGTLLWSARPQGGAVLETKSFS